jgi:hypothetical protein
VKILTLSLLTYNSVKCVYDSGTLLSRERSFSHEIKFLAPINIP